MLAGTARRIPLYLFPRLVVVSVSRVRGLLLGRRLAVAASVAELAEFLPLRSRSLLAISQCAFLGLFLGIADGIAPAGRTRLVVERDGGALVLVGGDHFTELPGRRRRALYRFAFLHRALLGVIDVRDIPRPAEREPLLGDVVRYAQRDRSLRMRAGRQHCQIRRTKDRNETATSHCRSRPRMP